MRLRNRDLASRTVGGSVMLLDLVTNRYHSVGGSGVVLVERLQDGVSSTDELVEEMVSRFEVSRERAAEDVEAFLARLDDNGLLER